MDCVKMLKNKGYGKVEEENQSHYVENQHKHYSKFLIATLSTVALFFLTLLFVLALVRHEPADSATESIRVACNVTRYPNSCFTSLTSFLSNTTTTKAMDPQAILSLSLRVSIHELSNLASSSSLSVDCRELVDDAVSRLNDSLSKVEAAPKGLTEAEMADARTWVSAALTDQQTCLDGLEEIGSSNASEVKTKIERCGEYTSNTLAILANFKILA
ncbi:hypothetical protein HN51_027593 [Arachis hypogaea]|uniref:pectinesterase n=1 Tax=Arachis hypogaea TaxID=3818 RepID=A0A445BMD0_ARAHY|nr:pectinesterase 3 [Arachis hypogaea]RYR39824.1 hypothetical protein Ahy_A09g045457 [Arachis hypogaea]